MNNNNQNQTLRPVICITGLNINGMCTKRNKAKSQSVHRLLNETKTDILVLAETALTQGNEALIPHDDYKGYISPMIVEDSRHARGNGMGLVVKSEINAHEIN